jgi:hypothetical protein
LEARFKQLVRLIEKELEAEDAGGKRKTTAAAPVPAPKKTKTK